MVKVSSFQNRLVPVSIEVDGDIINLKVRPYAVTPEMELSEDNAMEMFVAFIAEWDVTDDDGNPWPINVDSLNVFPSFLLVQIVAEARKKTIVLGK